MYSRAVLSIVLLAASAAPVFAQDIDRIPDWKAREAEQEKPFEPRQQLFISPSGEPFRAAMGAPYPVDQWFAQADKNHDGAIDRDEFTADQMAFFDKLDANHDGLIDGFESQAYEKVMVPEIAEGGERMGPPRKKGGFFGFGGEKRPTGPLMMGAAGYNLLREPLPVRTADSDFDFKVTKAEALAVSAKRFDLLDKNKDGRIELSELPMTPAQIALADWKKKR